MDADAKALWASRFGRNSMIFEELRVLHDELQAECVERRGRMASMRERSAELRAERRQQSGERGSRTEVPADLLR